MKKIATIAASIGLMLGVTSCGSVLESAKEWAADPDNAKIISQAGAAVGKAGSEIAHTAAVKAKEKEALIKAGEKAVEEEEGKAK
jgi:hypothetical protein